MQRRKKAKTKVVAVVVDDKNAPDLNVLAEDIKTVAAAFRSIKNSRVNDRAIHILIKAKTGLAIRDIKFVIDAAAALESDYLKK